MKNRCLFTLLSTALVGQVLNAADGTWNVTTGPENWSDSTKWAGGIIADGVDSIATLTEPASGGVDILLDGDRTIGGIYDDGIVSNRYYGIKNDTLTFDVTTGVPTITLGGSGAGTALQIFSDIAGDDGLLITSGGGGYGRLIWSSNGGGLTGGIEVNNAVLRTGSFADNSGFGSNAITLSGTGAELQLGSANGSGKPITSDLVLAGSNLWISAARSDASNNFFLTGGISETGGARDIRYTHNGDNGTFTVTGDNAYTGNTEIGRESSSASVAVRVTHGNALGLGNSSVFFIGTALDNALELDGGITISDKALTLQGQGKGDIGSLRSVSGDNVWNGKIALGSVSDATIGVDADTLTVFGVVSGSSANGLLKVGDGTLVLSGNNNFSTGTQILSGTLSVESNSALGTGGVTLGDGVGTDTLLVGEGVGLSIASLALTSSAQFGFDLSGVSPSSQIEVLGDQTGSGTYTVNIFSDSEIAAGNYALMTIVGTAAATDFVLGVVPAGFDGSLDWSDGTLSLTVIPEAGQASLVLGCVGLLLGVCCRNRK